MKRSKVEGGRQKERRKAVQNQFENLKVWQTGMELVRKIYIATKVFPKEEQYGLTSQIRRAAISIPVNIAEGKGRYHKKEYIQFLYMARGSAYEVMTLLRTAQMLEYLSLKEIEELLDMSSQITAMLNGLIQAIR